MKLTWGMSDEAREVELYAQRDHLKKWHRYFAWFPIIVGVTDNNEKDCRCFEWIERRYPDVAVIRGDNALVLGSSHLRFGKAAQYRAIK